MVIDFHTHIFPERIAESALSGLSKRAGLTPSFDGTLGGLVSSSVRAGVDLSVSLPIATKPEQTVSINNFAMKVNQANCGVLSLGTMHPDFAGFEMELKRLRQNHVCGIKMHPVYQHFYANDERALAIYRCARDLGLVVVLHGGVDVGFPGQMQCTPLRCRRIIDAVKGIKLVVAHLGGYECWDDVERYLVGQDVYLDTSFTSHVMEPERLVSIIRRHGPNRILYGTDAPWADQKDELARMRSLPLTAEEQDQIFFRTAADLLGLCVTERAAGARPTLTSVYPEEDGAARGKDAALLYQQILLAGESKNDYHGLL